MYLKKIEIQGFKSFANKTVFDFKEGITAIVGPNGSGKSNVADAIRWVLGEQRVKQLRGGHMQDVIFAGTTTRKAQGFAYVAITIDNSDHALLVPFEEVTISRSLYRSGESEYAINQTPCRLKDVQELFFDTGIGKEGYSIIGQGQIERILSSKPEDRRELFDEAAGIVKFKKRKQEALKKLENENSHLQYISEMVRIKGKQLGPLKNQSEKAKEYQKLLEDVKKIDLQLYLKEEERLKNREDEVKKSQTIVQGDYQDVENQLVATKETYEEIDQRKESLDQLLKEVEEKIHHQEKLKISKKSQIEILRTKIAEGDGREKLSKERLDELEKTLEALEKEAEVLSKKQVETKETFHLIKHALSQLEDKVLVTSKEVEEAQIALENDAIEIQRLLESRGEILSTLSTQKAILNQQSTSSLDHNEQAHTLDELIYDKSQLLDEVQSLLQDKLAELEGLNNQLQSLRQNYEVDNQKLQIANKEKEELQNQYHKAYSNYEVLENMAQRYEGLGYSVQKVMEASKNHRGIFGIVADLIQTKSKYEEAIETAVGARMQNIVTSDAKVAKEFIDYLYQKKLGRATFLPMDRLDYQPYHFKKEILREVGVIGVASELVHYEAKYAKVIGFILDKTLVVESMDVGLALAKKYPYGIRMVTLKGDLLSPQGAMTGGAFKNKQNLLGRKRSLEESKVLIEEISNRLSLQAQKIEDLKNRLENNLKEQREGTEKKQELSLEIARQEHSKVQLEQDILVAKKEQESIGIKSDKLLSDLEAIKEDVYAQEILLKQNQQEEMSYKAQRSQNQRDLDKKAAQLSELMKERQIQNTKFVDLQNQIQFASQEAVRLSQTKQALLEQIDKLHMMAKDDDKQKEDFQENLLSLDEEIRILEAEILENSNYKIALEDEKKELTAQNFSFFNQREDLLSRKTQLDKEIFRIESELENIIQRRESYANTLWEDYELTYRGAKAFLEPLALPELPLATLYKNSKEIKTQMKQLGPINLAAIEEYKEVSKEYEFLSMQEKDLLEAAEALKKIIIDLDKGMNAQFKESFMAIQKEFDRVFKELFGGGQGTLELMEGEDIQEAGIVINVQPPGKKLQNMMQLSGGEKALTAISLLFAILNLKPSPFCLLDEIEAALDDSNVLRFAQYLHQLTKDTQFIIITHRRGTMTTSDRLYGITMQEKGVSTMVSVNLVEDSLTN